MPAQARISAAVSTARRARRGSNPQPTKPRMAKICMAFDEVEAVYLMAGVYDFALIVRGETMQDIGMFVAKKLSTIESVVSTGTHFIMRRYKDKGINLFEADKQADERSLIL